jgi:AcrR family transcriptional regulator
MTVGRSSEFDPDEVLETATELFWEHGFDGISISDLTDATGINRRSLYAAFGSKEELFGRAVRRYLDGRVDLAQQRDASVKALLAGSKKHRPRGNCRA